jgi:hypothetical protein
MNYTQLTAAICDYTQNFDQDFIDNIPVFVQQAEQRIYNSVQFPSIRKNVTGSTSANNKYLGCPNDFLAVYSMAVIDGTGAYEYLLNKDVNFIRQAYPQPTDTAIPKYYALFGTQTNDANELTFILGPTPDAIRTALSFTITTTRSQSQRRVHRGWVTTLILCCCMAHWLKLLRS